MEKPDALLLVGKPEGGGDDIEMAVKAFFRAGEKGDYAKAAKALKEAIALCNHDDDEEEEESSDDDEDSDELML